jgi:hypothetical protein
MTWAEATAERSGSVGQLGGGKRTNCRAQLYAEVTGLRYVSDEEPGIVRQRRWRMEFPGAEKGPLTDANVGALCVLLDDEFGEVPDGEPPRPLGCLARRPVVMANIW